MKKIIAYFFVAMLLMHTVQAQVNTILSQDVLKKEENKNNLITTGLANKDYVKGDCKVLRAEVFASPGYMAGCNNNIKHFEFTALITTNGPCTVQYRWERSDGATDSYAPRTLAFAAAGTQTVVQTWDLSPTEYEGWQAITVIVPNNILSNKAAFKIICCDRGSSGPDCKRNPYILTPCSESLLRSFKNLAGGIGVSNCHPSNNFPTVTGTMPENCFSFQSASLSNITFSSFYMIGRGNPDWRVIWGSVPGNFSYYGACAPDPIVFPHPGVIENHVFAARLIRKADYMAFAGSPKNYAAMAGVPAILPGDVAEIMSVAIEENGGYISVNEPADYDNVLSSKGIVVVVRMRDGSTHDCYLINNYDGAGTINWKQKTPGCK